MGCRRTIGGVDPTAGATEHLYEMRPFRNHGEKVVRDDLGGIDELFVIVHCAGVNQHEDNRRRERWQRQLPFERYAIDPYLEGHIVVGYSNLAAEMSNQASFPRLDRGRQERLEIWRVKLVPGCDDMTRRVRHSRDVSHGT
jgi:hypothetical protein